MKGYISVAYLTPPPRTCVLLEQRARFCALCARAVYPDPFESWTIFLDSTCARWARLPYGDNCRSELGMQTCATGVLSEDLFEKTRVDLLSHVCGGRGVGQHSP